MCSAIYDVMKSYLTRVKDNKNLLLLYYMGIKGSYVTKINFGICM